MRKIIFISVYVMILLFFTNTIVNATTLVDTLNKKFKKINFPHEEVIAKITISTKVVFLKGNNKDHDFLRALKVQEKGVHTFKDNGWRNEDQLLAETIDAGKIELEVGEGRNLKLSKTLRLKAYVYQCDTPMKKYRGGDIDEFFTKNVLGKAEECFCYDERLQGKNYPY